MTAPDTGSSLANLEDRTGKLQMEERMAGLLYLVWGCMR
jgi:hypothetical protein